MATSSIYVHSWGWFSILWNINNINIDAPSKACQKVLRHQTTQYNELKEIYKLGHLPIP